MPHTRVEEAHTITDARRFSVGRRSLDPKTQQVEIYRVGQPKEVLYAPSQLSGDNILPGFVLDLEGIF
jgi:hypothetical protein